MIRMIIAMAGLAPLIILAGLVYSSAFTRSSHYGAFIFYSIVYGFGCYLLFWIGKFSRSSAVLVVPLLIAAWIGPFILGHYYGYADAKFAVWRMVQNDASGDVYPAWKELDRDQVFDRYVTAMTGDQSGGFMAYLTLMAHEGWSGVERTRGLYLHVERKGVWVWIAWLLHLVFLLIAVAGAMGATLSDKDLKRESQRFARKYPSKPETKPAPATPQEPVRRENAAITITLLKEIEEDHHGWWIINAAFKGRDATFRAYYPDKAPSARTFFDDIHHALYRLKTEGPLAAISILGGVEGGLTANEALDQLMGDQKKIQYLLGSHYTLFENDERFFTAFFPNESSE